MRLSTVRAESRDDSSPIESDEALSKLLGVVRDTGLHHYALVLLMLDARIRPSEALALREEDFVFGAGPDDVRRSIHVRRGFSAGVLVETTKSGRSLQVQMSRRLRSVLMEVKISNGSRQASALFIGHTLPHKAGKVSEGYWST